MTLPKSLLVRFVAVAIVVLVLIPIVVVPMVLAEEVVVLSVDAERYKLIMLTRIALLFSDIPLECVEKYELFNMLYIYREGV